MQIKRSAWHSKISNLGKDYHKSNDNLCIYFWRFVLRCICLLVGIPIAIFAMWLLICSYFSNPMWPAWTILLLFFYSLVLFPALAICFVRGRLGKSPEMPYGNIVTEYIKAKKEKICPIIEYIN